jgi:hypothetical protein
MLKAAASLARQLRADHLKSDTGLSEFLVVESEVFERSTLIEVGEKAVNRKPTILADS